MKKRISLILSGGTIATVNQNGVLRLSGETDGFKKFGFQKIISPFRLLSENFTFEEIGELYSSIKTELDSKDADAVVLAQGSDNLVFASAALSLLFASVKKTLVIVCADYPLSDPRSNGTANLQAAIDFIGCGISGVYVAYKNSGEDVKIHFGSRLNLTRGFDGYVSSASDSVCGYFDATGKFCAVTAPRKAGAKYRTRLPKEQSKVQFLVSYLGQDFSAYKFKKGTALVLDAYHSGTVRTEKPGNINEVKFPVFIAGAKTGDKYESTEKLENPLVRFVENIAPAALFFKVALSLSLPKKKREEYLSANIANEYFD